MSLTLRMGDTGDEVRTWQTLLVMLGYDLVVDGQYGPATYGVTAHLQGGLGLVADGVASITTYMALGFMLCRQRTAK
jgi:peptidoglycan hydrolase-like protein with peptidoglycan-binding domain